MNLSRRRALAFALLFGCTGEIANDASSPLDSAPGVPRAVPSAAGSGATAAGSGARSAAPNAGVAAGPASGGSTTLNLSGAPQYTRFVRLTNAQWAQSVRDILNLASPPGLEANFQAPVGGTTDFNNNELVLGVDQRAAADFLDAAESIATTLTASVDGLARIYPGTDAAGFIATLGRRAYRRPLTSNESTAYLTLFEQGATLSGAQAAFATGAGLVIRAMLQSPHFLYRTELGDGGTALNAYEIAAKLSLWLRGTTPSDALLDAAAASGSLDTADGAATLAATMLGEPAAVQVMRTFHNQLYHFERYSEITKIGVIDYDPSLNTEFFETSLRFFDKLFTQGLGVREMLTSTSGFVGPRMAALYGVTPPTTGYVEAELGPRRIGYFSQIPFLSLYGHNDEPDSIHRGVSMNLDVLCAVLGPPAANLPPIPALEPGQTNRQRISKLTEGCGGVCHNQQINPLGFSFEHFDGMGRYRETESGNLPIVSSGSFMFTEGRQSFEAAADLMVSMAASQQAHTCYAKKLASFSLQRDIVGDDVSLLNALTKVSLENGSMKSIMLALVRDDAFRVRSGGGK